MNGPKLVCMSATKKTNQSSPRRLAREGSVGWPLAFRLGCIVSTATPRRPARCYRDDAGPGSVRRHRRRGSQDDHWLAVFVLGSSLHLSPCKVHDDTVQLVSRSETQNAPVD